MIYRPMGKSGVQVSALSMGGGHLPDDPEACDALLRACVDAGINYYETATFYCNGQCQQKIGRGLEPVRSNVMISVKRGILLVGEQPGCAAPPARPSAPGRSSPAASPAPQTAPPPPS